ncbi:hypothetical protein RDWZM_001838 [Blomia tropicalis]|uniref:Peptidase C1A papain C-terminal domain-containing protein n=1 Tax=Blomia tropicalis TaxID=40697 RepID=A0A9Q0MBG2_BLOTA|nr:hypothetical protein RDWZM_001838 [Blomia tropicalis]
MSLFVQLMSLLVFGSILANGRVMISKHVNILSDEMIDEINQLDTTWKAGRNFDIDTPIEDLFSLLGVKRSSNQVRLPLKIHNIDEVEAEPIPIEFDARKHWPNCLSISLIRDQGSCGSCWAVAATEVMSDRICIHSNGIKQVNISAQHLVSCCTTCGVGCSGGDLIAAWKYYKTNGIVSGGQYNSHQGCQPYLLPECSHTGTVNGTRPPCGKLEPTPACSNKCETGYSVLFNDDKHYASHVYSIEKNVTSLQYEIMKNGPVEADFTVYSDFFHYKSVNGTRPPCGDAKPTPPCSNKCETGYNVSFYDDKHYASHIYSIENNVTSLQYEIMKNGPVEAELTVYSDFFHYKSGVYQNLTNDLKGYHAVKILGWGIENGTPYWLCANSWNDEWGDHGYFKIRRDTNECDIMDNLNAGIPLL